MKKVVLATLACTLFAFTAVANASPFYDGYDDGQTKADDMWVVDFGEDCYSFFEFSKEAEKELIKKEYKKKKGDNWYVKEFKKGGKKGVENYIAEIEEICLDPEMCDEMGEAAATSVVAVFCGRKGGHRDTITEQCRDFAIEVCEGGIYDALEEWLNAGLSCKRINDDIGEITFSDIRKMRENCEETVDMMIDG